MKKGKLTPEDIRFLFNELRKASVIWDGRKEVLRAVRKKVFVRRAKNGKAVYKYHWQCSGCGKWFDDEKRMEVDHIKEIGGVEGFTGDWNETINKIFPRPVSEHLQALCHVCHSKKTRTFMNSREKWKRKRSCEAPVGVQSLQTRITS